jgi:hypothetical protein
MAVFLAACDETGTHDGRGNFYSGGYMAPTLDWVHHFTPAWEDRVLNREPRIPYLHMTSIRSKAWRAKHGISGVEAERRVDSACDVIASTGSLFLITARINEGLWRDRFKSFGIIRENTKQVAVDRMPPDLQSFFGFVTVALQYGVESGAEKVDFIIERKHRVTQVLLDMFEKLRGNYPELGEPEYAALMGKLVAGGKDHVPLQAADLACWHVQRQDQQMLDPIDYKRMRTIGSKFGQPFHMKDEWTERTAAGLEASKVPSPFTPKIKPTAKYL